MKVNTDSVFKYFYKTKVVYNLTCFAYSLDIIYTDFVLAFLMCKVKDVCKIVHFAGVVLLVFFVEMKMLLKYSEAFFTSLFLWYVMSDELGEKNALTAVFCGHR